MSIRRKIKFVPSLFYSLEDINVTTLTDLLASFKDEMMARYKSPFWGVALIALIFVHWEIFFYLFLDQQNSTEAIAYIKKTVSIGSVGSALAFAIAYIIFFPWLELSISKLASYGIRARNDFQIREREREIGRRKLISNQEAQLIEAEFKNKADQSKLADIELAKHYQNILSGENFARWLRDAEKGAINSNLSNSIYNYLNKVDSLEGRFVNPVIENVHEKFIESISTLNSTFQDSRGPTDSSKISDLKKLASNTYHTYQQYRQAVREQLGI
jgi:hypothetical protein